MRVKINDTWYDDTNDKIAIIFDDYQIYGIKEMTPETHPKNRLVSGVFDSLEDAKAWADE